jgi:hypothetical protein
MKSESDSNLASYVLLARDSRNTLEEFSSDTVHYIKVWTVPLLSDLVVSSPNGVKFLQHSWRPHPSLDCMSHLGRERQMLVTLAPYNASHWQEHAAGGAVCVL